MEKLKDFENGQISPIVYKEKKSSFQLSILQLVPIFSGFPLKKYTFVPVLGSIVSLQKTIGNSV